MISNQVIVGMADFQTSKDSTEYLCLGLGSCIGLCALDPQTNISGLAHIMLPKPFPNKPIDKPGKFAPTAIKTLTEQMISMGASLNSIRIAYVGGAKVFSFGDSKKDHFDIGSRNIQSVEEIISEMRLQVIATDVGGTSGRTIMMSSDTGEIKVRIAAGKETLLCKLK